MQEACLDQLEESERRAIEDFKVDFLILIRDGEKYVKRCKKVSRNSFKNIS